MNYIGIDVGITNLAIVKCVVKDFKIRRVIEAHRINLGELKHIRVSEAECKLYHTNDVYDRIQHFLQEYDWVFKDVDQIFIERQPITGLVHVEQVLFGHFRSKAKLVSPNAMHRFFNIQHYDYEGRKEQTMKIAQPYIESVSSYNWSTDRVHDMADAICLLLYSLHVEKKQNEGKQKLKIFEENLKENYKKSKNSQTNLLIDDSKTLDDFFNQFKFNHKTSAKEFMKTK